jgi:hypothetical protein
MGPDHLPVPSGCRRSPARGCGRAALHVEQDACLIEELEAGLDRTAEQGWRYSDADLGAGAPPPPGDPVLAPALTPARRGATCGGGR